MSLAKIVINLGLRQLYYYKDQEPAKVYPIAIGKPSTPTPTGSWQIVAKIRHPGGILGTRWLGLDIPDGPYGIHGTPHPWTIGKAISHGCIRMYNQDVEELFLKVKVGTTVEIITNWQSSSTPPPQATPPTQPAKPISESPDTYVVQSGDSVWSIAQRFNLNMEELINANNFKNPNVIKVGQKLKIPLHT